MMTKSKKQLKEKENEVEKMTMCAIWLIKNLCIETQATRSVLDQDITHFGEKIGRYRITIEKI